MLRIVTDGAGDMPAEWLEAYDLQIIPINIQFKEQTFLQGIDLSNEDFYRLVDQSGVIPKTSQPTPQQFVDFYRRVAKAGDTILSMHVTAKLSGTYESAIMASRELEGVYRVIPFDSATGSAGLGFLCKEARLMDRGGASIEEILQRMESLRESMHIVLTLA
jgi:DegV family protein with EDD domain